MFTKLREMLADLIDKDAVEAAIAQAKAEVRAQLETTKAEVDSSIEQAGPQVQAAVDAAFSKLLGLL